MASTSQLLTWAELQCHGWTREGVKGSRALLNEAHTILLCDEREQNVVLDPTTGDLPFLRTRAGVFAYALPDNCWKLAAILIDTDTALGATDYGGLEVSTRWNLEPWEFAGVEYYRVRNVRSFPARNNANATMQFMRVDPGESRTTFRQEYYRRPTPITSDAVQHEMPLGAEEEYLLPATVKLIQSINNGNIELARDYIRRTLKPLFQAELDTGEQGSSDFCEKRAY